ncbi:MAG: CPBP family glutamic-type intramembrane protease [Alteripontixanthobacter sp.]
MARTRPACPTLPKAPIPGIVEIAVRGLERLAHLLRWPDARHWRRCIPVAVLGTALVGLIAWLTGLTVWQPTRPGWELIGIAAILLIAPSFLEELLFRGVLHPPSNSRWYAGRAMLVVTAFVLWDPLQYWSEIGPPWSRLFITPGFLSVVISLGIVLAMLRIAGSSLWPPILFHWIVVLAWKLLFGGPF